MCNYPTPCNAVLHDPCGETNKAVVGSPFRSFSDTAFWVNPLLFHSQKSDSVGKSCLIPFW